MQQVALTLHIHIQPYMKFEQPYEDGLGWGQEKCHWNTVLYLIFDWIFIFELVEKWWVVVIKAIMAIFTIMAVMAHRDMAIIMIMMGVFLEYGRNADH